MASNLICPKRMSLFVECLAFLKLLIPARSAWSSILDRVRVLFVGIWGLLWFLSPLDILCSLWKGKFWGFSFQLPESLMLLSCSTVCD